MYPQGGVTITLGTILIIVGTFYMFSYVSYRENINSYADAVRKATARHKENTLLFQILHKPLKVIGSIFIPIWFFLDSTVTNVTVKKAICK